MKKINLFILATLPLMLSACASSFTYTPKAGGTSSYVEPPREKDTTIEFYVSYTYSEDPIYTLPYYMLEPIGSCPEEINSADKVIAIAEQRGYVLDPTFTKFIGFSFYPCCLDEDGLWNFETDYKQQAVTCLYGIWVSE